MMAQDSPKMAQDAPKMPQDGPKMAPRCFKMSPKWPQDGSKIPITWLKKAKSDLNANPKGDATPERGPKKRNTETMRSSRLFRNIGH